MSLSSKESQANLILGGVTAESASWDPQSASRVVFPKPAGAETSVSLPPEFKPSSKCLIKRDRCTRLGRVWGVYSFVAKIGVDTRISLVNGEYIIMPTPVNYQSLTLVNEVFVGHRQLPPWDQGPYNVLFLNCGLDIGDST